MGATSNSLKHAFAADEGHPGAALEFAALEGGIAGARVQGLRRHHEWLAVIVLWRHRENIARLRAGTEPRVGRKKDAA
jgi:hypothetical protein